MVLIRALLWIVRHSEDVHGMLTLPPTHPPLTHHLLTRKQVQSIKKCTKLCAVPSTQSGGSELHLPLPRQVMEDAPCMIMSSMAQLKSTVVAGKVSSVEISTLEECVRCGQYTINKTNRQTTRACQDTTGVDINAASY